ncbi:MAG: hypothetical protein COZ68_02070 [Deltaproteobacteria bacterium CG_4_8_14_3_um_filter_43_13]|nr:MAG: hypothetical protein COS67_05875 [Deltaproteobacteria bacterium CG06_land_8_20_14_3_00_44_19]PIX26151.1 MAG: hypothetical protein COZ68_02070 [Deltaproteobacteria bacterium CG_4_8_14_3_um_filter_43_13]PIZ19431.1 MAG: hypothetical protein COY50_10080 [Deltaproteobacteria bacterium CG_4_10_14_0_8_um_filter_43_12]
MDVSGHSVLNEIKKRRKSIIEIILVAIILGILLNVTGGILFDFIKDRKDIQLSELLLLISAILIILTLILNRRISETLEFRLLLPLKEGDDDKYFEKIKGYAPSEVADRIYSKIINSEDHIKAGLNKEVAECLRENIPQNMNIVLKLVQALIVDVIRKYGEHSLTTASLYHGEYRHLSWKFKTKKIEKENLQKRLSENEFIRGKIIVPTEVSLSYETNIGKTKGEFLELSSRYSSLKIEILPGWALLREGSKKTLHIALRTISDRRNLILVFVPLKCTLHIKESKIFSRRTEDLFSWMYGLMLDLNRWLSWDEYMKGDIERIIVDIHGRVKNLSETKVKPTSC